MPFLPQVSSTVSQTSVLSEGIRGDRRNLTQASPECYIHSASERADAPLVNMLSSLKDHGYWERSLKANVRSIFKKGQNYDSSNPGPLSLPSVTGKIMQ